MVYRLLPPCRYNMQSGSFFPVGVKTLPLYAYRCTQCGHRFEKIQHFRSKPELVCPKCHGALERPLTAPGLKFKGAGFYVNDYPATSSMPAAESAPATGTESAPAQVKTPCGESCGAACPAAIPAAGATPATN